MLGHRPVNGRLIRVIERQLPEAFQNLPIWITERPQIRSVDLGVPIELTEETIRDGGIEEATKTTSERSGKACALPVEKINVILNPQHPFGKIR